MIYDRITNINTYKGLSPDIYEGLKFLRQVSPDIAVGTHQINPRVKAIVSEYETKQVNEYAKISLNAPNLYNILSTKYMSDKNLSTLLVIMTVGIVALFSIYLYKKKGETGDGDMIVISYLFALLMPYFLPHMHERYFYLADIFAVLFAFSYKKKSYISVITIYASLRVVVKYLFDSSGSNINLVNIGILMTVGVAMLVLFIVNGENTKTRGCNGFDRV